MADPNVRQKDLPGGLRVFSEPLSEATSVSLGVWIRAGSRDEREEVAGITHLMEHMLFKGTPEMDALGGVGVLVEGLEGVVVDPADGLGGAYDGATQGVFAEGQRRRVHGGRLVGAGLVALARVG